MTKKNYWRLTLLNWLRPFQPVVDSTSACMGGLWIIFRAFLIYTLDLSPRPSGPLTFNPSPLL